MTNRERYVGAAACLELFSRAASFPIPYAGAQGARAVMAQAERIGCARAWDAYCKTRKRFRMLRGVPGGVLPLATLERLSTGFSAWLDAPCDDAFMDPKGEPAEKLQPEADRLAGAAGLAFRAVAPGAGSAKEKGDA